MPIDDVRLDARAVLRQLGAVPELVTRDVRTRFRSLGQTLRNELRLTIASRSGRARRAVFAKMDRAKQRGDIAVLVGGNLAKAPHLKTLEQGATLKPKHTQAMTVPIGRMATRHGAAKYKARDVRDNPQAFGFVRTWVRRDVILGETLAGDVVPLFALRRSILFPRRAYFKNFARKNRGRILREVESIVSGSLAAAGEGQAGPSEA